MDADSRKYPNILITGTPGCGKSTLAQDIVNTINEEYGRDIFQHVNVSDVVKNEKLYTSYDSDMQTYDIDEDKTLDHIEEKYLKASALSDDDKSDDDMSDDDDNKSKSKDQGNRKGGALVFDWHICDIFAERWIDLVVVLRCDHTKLWDRLEKRKYPKKKIEENNEAEIMQVILDEARESYDADIVVELQSETNDQLQENTERVVEWIKTWRKDQNIA